VGTNLTHSQSNSLVDPKAGINMPNDTATDDSAITYLFGFRKYFQGFSPAVKNPDLVPSLGLTFDGSNTIAYGAGRTKSGSAGTLPQDLSDQGYSLTLDFRAPLDDEWTLVPSLEGSYSRSRVSYTAFAAGSQSIIRSLTPGLETRYYLVGRNLISKDSRQNPDQWTMFFLDLGGTARITGQSESISVTGVVSPVETPGSDSLSIAVGTRLPVSNHMTLRFQIGGALAHSSLPETSGQQGTATTTPTVNFAALLKYYFF
jgi:hypothetical protein